MTTLPLSLDQIQRVQRGEPVEVEVPWAVQPDPSLDQVWQRDDWGDGISRWQCYSADRQGVIDASEGYVCPYPVGARVGVLEAWQNNFSLHLSHGGYLFESTAATDQSWHGNWARQLPDGTWVDHYDRPFVWRSAASMPLWAIRTHVLVTQSDARVVDGRAVWVVTIVIESGVADAR